MIWVTLLYIAFIYGNSATPGNYSSAESSWVTDFFNDIMNGLGLTVVQLSEGFIRKAAHFTEYTGLGILLTLSLLRYDFFAGKRRWRLVPVGFLVACVDETIQYFTPGRHCSIWDVLLDTCGVFFGVAVCAFITWCKNKRKMKRGEKV